VSRGETEAFTLAVLLVASAGSLACAGEKPSLSSLRTSADERIARGTPNRASEDAQKLLAEPLTPESAARVALLNNHDVLAAYEKLGVAHAELVEALRVPNPRADAALRFRHSGPPEIEVLATIGLSDLAFLPLRGDAASAELEAERLEVIGFIVDLAFDVRNAFVAYQAAEQALELDRTVLAATAAAADAAARLHEAGNLTDLDLANQRAFNEEARVMERRAETARVEARAHLNELMGLGASAEWAAAVARLPDPPAEELALEGLEQRALARNLDLKIAERRANAADKRVTVATAEGVLPELRGGVSARREGEWGIGPAASLEVPLFYQGQGAVERARSERSGERDRHTQLTVKLRVAAHTLAEALKSARANAVEYRDVLLPLRQRVLDQTELEYNAMAVGVFQLLVAKREEVETARAYVDLLREYWTARTEVERLEAGKIAERSLLTK
jgi:cobalt-zinc-cadmium efflux system outer membrane protein